MDYNIPMFHVVDDEDYVRELVTAMLERQGYETMAFGSPTDYIHFVKSSDFSDPVGVFIDVKMPVMAGYELMNIVTKYRPGLKFVVMTAGPEISPEYATKACMYLGKPFRMDTLIKIADSLTRCHASAPSDSHGCANVDDRKMFPTENWSCPYMSDDCPSVCS